LFAKRPDIKRLIYDTKFGKQILHLTGKYLNLLENNKNIFNNIPDYRLNFSKL